MLKEYIIKITTDGSGDAVDTTDTGIFGKLYAVAMVDGDFADGVDAVIIYTDSQGVERTLLTLTNWNSDRIYYPREQVHSNTGAALTYDGTYPVTTTPIIAGPVQVTTDEGGATKSGAVILYVEE